MAWTPLLLPINNDSIMVISDHHLAEYLSQRKGRRQVNDWKAAWRSEILQEISYIPIIQDWLAKSIAMEVENLLHVQDTVDVFIEVQIFESLHQPDSAIQVLCSVQKKLEKLCFSSHGSEGENQVCQHNLLDEITSGGDGDASGEDDQVVIGEASHIEINSPKRKRQRLAETDKSILSFEQFDSLPVLARSAPEWNQLFAENPNFWREKCDEWYLKLDKAYKVKEDKNLSINVVNEHYVAVVLVLREIRQVEAKIYKQSNWISVVKASQLGQMICKWSDPKGLALWKGLHIQHLIRRHRITDTLSLVLEDWTPKESYLEDNIVDDFPVFSSVSMRGTISNGKELFNALKKYPDMIPLLAHPSSVFFLLDVNNFIRAVKEWLGYALEAKLYNATILGNQQGCRLIYRQIIEHLSKAHQSGQLEQSAVVKPQTFEKNGLFVILQRTATYRDNIKITKTKSHAYHTVKEKIISAPDSIPPGQCKYCYDKTPEDQCIQTVYVTVSKLDEFFIGHGVSLVDNAEFVKAQRYKRTPPPVLHPKNLGFKKYGPNEEIIQRCGQFVYRVVEKDTKKLLDVYIYNAFPSEILERLNNNHMRFQRLKNIKRGQQFDFYSQGQMISRGSRAPMGGIPGDSYTMYSGMGADSIEAMHSLFDDAEDGMIFDEIVRPHHPEVVKGLQEESMTADRLGTSGATQYRCHNYTSPLHRDDDAARGLCAQYELCANEKLHEYAFVYADYGIYMIARSNSLWTFHGGDTHCTILPHPIPPGDPGNISAGKHKTKTKKNAAAANKYHRVRQTKERRNQFWDK